MFFIRIYPANHARHHVVSNDQVKGSLSQNIQRLKPIISHGDIEGIIQIVQAEFDDLADILLIVND